MATVRATVPSSSGVCQILMLRDARHVRERARAGICSMASLLARSRDSPFSKAPGQSHPDRVGSQLLALVVRDETGKRLSARAGEERPIRRVRDDLTSSLLDNLTTRVTMSNRSRLVSSGVISASSSLRRVQNLCVTAVSVLGLAACGDSSQVAGPTPSPRVTEASQPDTYLALVTVISKSPSQKEATKLLLRGQVSTATGFITLPSQAMQMGVRREEAGSRSPMYGRTLERAKERIRVKQAAAHWNGSVCKDTRRYRQTELTTSGAIVQRSGQGNEPVSETVVSLEWQDGTPRAQQVDADS